MKRYLLWLAVAAIALLAVAVATHFLQSSEDEFMSKDQAVIDECWQEAKGTTISPAQQQVVINACEMLEKAYRLNNGAEPAPRKKDEYLSTDSFNRAKT